MLETEYGVYVFKTPNKLWVTQKHAIGDSLMDCACYFETKRIYQLHLLQSGFEDTSSNSVNFLRPF